MQESPKSSGDEGWGFDKNRRLYTEVDELSAGSQSDENGQASGDEYDYQATNYLVDDYDDRGNRAMRPVDDDGTQEEDEDDNDAEDSDNDGSGGMEIDEEVEDDQTYHHGRNLNAYGNEFGHNNRDLNAYDDDEEEIEDDMEDIGDEGDADEGASSFSDYSD